MSKAAQEIILAPVITEKSMTGARDLKKYTFKVANDANKIEIAKAIEELFKVEVKKVNTINMDGKNKRRGMVVGKTSKTKKAIVWLTEDSKDIELYPGL